MTQVQRIRVLGFGLFVFWAGHEALAQSRTDLIQSARTEKEANWSSCPTVAHLAPYIRVVVVTANKMRVTTLLLNEAGSHYSAPTIMSDQLPVIYIARHGETAWTITGQHTGLTDLPLTPQGESNARGLGERLNGLVFAKVFTSPLQRARQTCTLAGFGQVAEVDDDLVEWNYGDYEGLRSTEIRAKRRDWELFRDGAPGGETPAHVMARADKVVSRVRNVKGDALIFSSGHFIRVFAARWIGLEPSVHSNSFLLSTASLSAVGYDRNMSHPVIRLWNDTHHVRTQLPSGDAK